MKTPELDVVTGAFGYTGKYITRRLLDMGCRVITLTGHPNRLNPFGDLVKAYPFTFDKPEELVRSLQGVATLYNIYWVRFPMGKITFDRAVENTKTLIRAAEMAGVRRVVHVSITNASIDSPFPYFRGKGQLEKAIVHSKLSYAIIRPTVIFGLEDILINNIAWILRRFPVFAVPGSGNYRVQPVFVGDVAEIAVSLAQKEENMIIDAVGPEVYTFDELVRLIAKKVHSRARIIHMRPKLAFFFSKLVGYGVRDVVLTWDEVRGLMANLLVSESPPTGLTSLEEWLDQNSERVGTRYASEMARHYC